MLQIRQSVFETNSSSSHSLTLGNTVLSANVLTAAEARGGVVSVELGEYGWGFDEVHGFHGKASYLVTQIATRLNVDLKRNPDDLAKLYADPRMKQLKAEVLRFTGADLTVAVSEGYVDHQSVGIEEDLFNDPPALRRFLFDAASFATIDNDNH